MGICKKVWSIYFLVNAEGNVIPRRGEAQPEPGEPLEPQEEAQDPLHHDSLAQVPPYTPPLPQPPPPPQPQPSPSVQPTPPSQPQPVHRSPLERLRKYGAIAFRVKKEDDLAAAEYWMERTDRLLQQLHYTPKQQLERALSLLEEDAYRWGSAPPPTCTHCGRPHRGECRLLTGGCFRCGSTYHFLKDCPQRNASVPTARPQMERAVEEEVESHAPPTAEIGGRGEPTPPVPEVPTQPPHGIFQQMAKFFRQMARVMPPPPPP
ncbi:uncharacterized protein LOC131182890 [Hevea brasiliensis]|uniref:uncharacterized protein LOC131182890 n=1 Tax=Hevea brasiliensis TaxID=3981 RepID=UPI0025DA0310|nr:uncharacterized protein LOC131182890 [Hevea brasiliensis]